MNAIHTDNAPAAIGPYSQAIEVNGFVFASGQIPIDPATGNFVEGGIKEQTRQSLTNAQNILKAAGTDLSHVVKTTVYLNSMDDFAAMNEVYAEFFIGLSSTGGSANFIIVDASGNNVTAAFSGTTPEVSYSEE